MKLDLDPLPCMVALDILKWCFENDVDRKKAIFLTEMMGIVPTDWPEHVDWTLDVPDSYASWIILRWA